MKFDIMISVGKLRMNLKCLTDERMIFIYNIRNSVC